MPINNRDELSSLINRSFQALGAEWFALTRYRRALAVLRWLRQEDLATTVTTVQLVAALDAVYFQDIQLVDVCVRLALAIDAANRANLGEQK